MAFTRKTETTRQFPCSNCGALQTYSPGAHSLKCPYCDHESPIIESSEQIREYPFHEALKELSAAPASNQEQIATQCETCAAEFTFDRNVHSGECPFCGTAVVTKTGQGKPVKPKSLIPFAVTEEEAKKRFRGWLKGLWFAPEKLKNYANTDNKLTGVYIPYWTYDSDTTTQYRGERGDAYQVRENYTAMENGRPVKRSRTVTKIRWTRTAGTVNRFFDDVLIGASKTLPRTITDRLAPWDLDKLVPYQEKYLSGFRSEVYQVRLDAGFALAVKAMDRVIRQDIMRDIGGDVQRIQHVSTRHNRTTFKHLLLPIWTAGFRYRGKTYRFVVNGQTGQVQGERPYSYFKIALAALAAIVLMGGLIALLSETGVLEALLYNLDQMQR